MLEKKMSRYTQYRLAKRDGEIVQQKRTVSVEPKYNIPLWKIWKIWSLATYEVIYNYGEWEDVPFADADEN
jgi:hypothetical protein